MFKTQNLYQNDDQWKNVRLGNSYETISSWGCLLTSATMMLNGIGYNETPQTVNEKMKKAGGFQGAFFIPSAMPYIWPNCIYRDMQPCQNAAPLIAQIDAAVAAGKPVILQVDWSKQTGVQTHFVLVKDKKGDDYVLYDPYKYAGDGPDKEVLLTSRYRYNGAKLATEISAVLWFDCYNAQLPEPPKMTRLPLPAEKYTLYVCENDLALRGDPSLSGYLWKRMLMGTELLSLEPKAAAKTKVGVDNQWINVQDPAGDQGYVAAWFVSETKPQPASSTTTMASVSSAPSATGNLPPGALALIPTQLLSFRSAPVITPENVIRVIQVTETLISVEPATDAIQKVGVNGKWLRVRDAAGKEGYVAAWFVKYASGSSAQQNVTATTAVSNNGGPLIVKTTAEGTALRSQPVVSDATLIKRLPLGTQLAALEPNAASKIGQNNQWMKVKDPTGTEGFVAAWFVAP